jgi:hypothetical protein
MSYFFVFALGMFMGYIIPRFFRDRREAREQREAIEYVREIARLKLEGNRAARAYRSFQETVEENWHPDGTPKLPRN